MMRCLALDIGGTKIASAIVSGNQVTQRQQIHTPQENVVEAMHQTLAQLLSDYAGQFDYVAVASTGIINKGILTALNPKNLGGLAYFPLKQSLSQHTSKPVYLLNDAQAATYAEYQRQDKKLIRRVLKIYRQIPAENNEIIRRWKIQGIEFQNALETQSCLYQYKVWQKENR